MTPRNDGDDSLERLVTRVLRAQPLLRAPASLETRILAQLDRQASRPWWWRGFDGWPLAGRLLMVAVCCTCVAAVWIFSIPLWARLTAAAAHPDFGGAAASVLETGRVICALGSLAAHLLRTIPREWLLGGLIATGTLYAILFALVAIGYSLLCSKPEHSKVG
ncbi:MAG: hypothetical protein ACREU2_12770 [Steroidobacteraceae bacterium]